MRTYAISIILILFSLSTFSQTNQWQWAHRAGGDGFNVNGHTEEGVDIVVDQNNDVYVCGHIFPLNTTFDTVQVNFNVTDLNIFLAKYSCEGELLWYRVFGSDRRDLVSSMTIDDAGYIYITGQIPDGQFGDAILGDDTLASFGGLYVSKFDSAGNNIWNRVSYSGAFGHQIESGPNGSLYVYGLAGQNEIQIYSQYTVGGILGGSPFLMKMDTSGSIHWVKNYGDTTYSYKSVFITNDMAVSDNGDIYLGGYHQYDTLYFQGDTIIRKSDENDIILAKFDSSGNYEWVQRAGGSGVNSINGLHVYGEYIFFNGGISTSGVSTIQDADFESIYVSDDVGPGSVPYLACYRFDGTARWVKVPDNIQGSSSASSSDLFISDSGGVFWCGSYSGNLTFGNYTFQINTISGLPSYFVKYDTSGQFLEAFSPMLNGSNGANSALAISADLNGNMIYTGKFEDRIILNDLNDTINNEGGGDWDIIIAKYGNGDCSIPQDTSVNDSTIDTTGVSVATYTYDALQISPNPVNANNIDLYLSEPTGSEAIVRIYNSTGQNIWEDNISAGTKNIRPEKRMSPGLYIIELRTGSNTYTKKLLVTE